MLDKIGLKGETLTVWWWGPELISKIAETEKETKRSEWWCGYLDI